MDVELLVLGILVVAFDAYAYKKYVEGRDRLESAYSTRQRALLVKKQFEEDQKPAETTATQKTGTALAEDAGLIAPPAPGLDIEIPFKQPAPKPPTEFVQPVQPTPTEAELAVLRSELAALQKKISSLEKTIIARTAVRATQGVTQAELDAKEAELQKMFFKRQIDPETYRAMRAEMTRMRLGL